MSEYRAGGFRLAQEMFRDWHFDWRAHLTAVRDHWAQGESISGPIVYSNWSDWMNDEERQHFGVTHFEERPDSWVWVVVWDNEKGEA